MLRSYINIYSFCKYIYITLREFTRRKAQFCLQDLGKASEKKCFTGVDQELIKLTQGTGAARITGKTMLEIASNTVK